MESSSLEFYIPMGEDYRSPGPIPAPRLVLVPLPEPKGRAAAKGKKPPAPPAPKLVDLLLGSNEASTGASAASASSGGPSEAQIDSIRSLIAQPLLYCVGPSPGSEIQVQAQQNQAQFSSILEYSYYCRPAGWSEIFASAYNILARISGLVAENEIRYQNACLPYKSDVFNAFHLTPLDRVRVVLIGQDPYPGFSGSGHPEAQGLSFSVSRENDKIPPSLKNIFKELERSIPGFRKPTHGDLSRWAVSQGVLLLNTCLTYQPGMTKGSKDQKAYLEIWLPFICLILNVLSAKRPKTIYILLGAPAQKFEQYINEKSFKSKASHPSPLNCSAREPFIGSNAFLNVNRYLVEVLKEEVVDWNLD